MKRIILLAIIALTFNSAMAQLKFVDATELGIHGYTQKTDKSPYFRFDHTPYEGFNTTIINYSKYPSGLYIVCKTNNFNFIVKF